MGEEVILKVFLNQDFVLKNRMDIEMIGLFQLTPNSQIFTTQKRVKAHTILLLDSSGSMDHVIDQDYTKRQAVIEGATSLLQQFQRDDRVTVITYNSQATVLDQDIPAGNTKRIENAIHRINDFDGATNFEAAMEAASKVATSDNCHVVFLTDGISVTGDDKRALEISNQLGKGGVTVNAMGIGKDFNFDFMRRFSEGSNGTTENIEAHERNKTQHKIRQIFSEILQWAQHSVIRDVFMYISFSSVRDLEFCQLTPEKRLLTHHIRNRHDGTSFLEVPVGQLVANTSKDYVFSFGLSTTNESSMALGSILINYSVPQLNLQDQRIEQQLVLNLSSNEKDKSFDSDVVDAYEDIKLLKYYYEVNDFLDKGEYETAARRLKEMISIADRLSDFNRKKEIQGLLNNLIHNGYLTKEEINRLAASSTVSSIVGRQGGYSYQPSLKEEQETLGG